MLYKGTRRVKNIKVNGRNCRLILKAGRQVWPCRKPLKLPTLEYRMTNDGGEKFFEVGFTSGELLEGSAATGWQDVRGYVTIQLQQSENLTAWQEGLFVDCADSPEDMPDGSFRYWSRCIFPVDSTIKTGRMRAVGRSPGDPRNGPFTALTLGGVVQSLPGFPYSMPTDSARLQADLRAIGWTGATVTASNLNDWEIIIPGVYYNGASIISKIYWPVYYVADMFGNINTPVDGVSFSGEFVNEDGIRTALSKQFARMAVRRGPRVLP
jgi:hypothetical protein